MVLTLNLSPEIEQHLIQEAEEQGLSVEAFTLQILLQGLAAKQQAANPVQLLQSWIDEGDAEEQQETGQFLIQALDQDRLSERPLFPLNMQGVTW